MSEPRMRLNVFQRLMRQWKELAPYNAGTLLRVAGPADVPRWECSIRRLISELGLGRPDFWGEDQVSFRPLETVTVEQADNLEQKTIDELNHIYTDDELPLRFFVCPGENDTHWLGIMFDHWLTDGRTIAEFCVRLAVRYAEPEASIPYPPHVLNGFSLEELFGDKIPPLTEAGPVREAARIRSEHREVARFEAPAVASFVTHFYHVKWPTEMSTNLHAQAHKWGATAHDLLLALIAQILSPGKAEISLASAIDIRSEAKSSVENCLGQFVSFYTNVIERPDQCSLEELTRHLAEKNRRIKQEGRALRNFGALEAARQGWQKALTLEEKGWQFHQLAPIEAGVSHMKVTRLQREISRSISRHRRSLPGDRESSPLLDATVVSPTGPLTPLLVTVNKLDSTSTMMGICYRTSVYTRPQIESFAQNLLNKLSELGV